MIYGLVAPGYEMAEIVAANMTGAERLFAGAELSAKLKLMGVDVASFGKYELPADQATHCRSRIRLAAFIRSCFFSKDGLQLLGGILVGDAADYGKLLMLSKSNSPLPCQPHELIVGGTTGEQVNGGIDLMPDTAQICSCNNVTKGTICQAIREQNIDTLDVLKTCTKAGTGCGGMFAVG